MACFVLPWPVLTCPDQFCPSSSDLSCPVLECLLVAASADNSKSLNELKVEGPPLCRCPSFCCPSFFGCPSFWLSLWMLFKRQSKEKQSTSQCNSEGQLITRKGRGQARTLPRQRMPEEDAREDAKTGCQTSLNTTISRDLQSYSSKYISLKIKNKDWPTVCSLNNCDSSTMWVFGVRYFICVMEFGCAYWLDVSLFLLTKLIRLLNDLEYSSLLIYFRYDHKEFLIQLLHRNRKFTSQTATAQCLNGSECNFLIWGLKLHRKVRLETAILFPSWGNATTCRCEKNIYWSRR